MNYIFQIKSILANTRQKAYSAINSAMVEAYWEIGERIVEEEQGGENRAAYEKENIKNLCLGLTQECGKGFTDRYIFTLYYQRLLSSQIKIEVENKTLQKTKDFKKILLNLLKTQLFLEFLNPHNSLTYTEQKMINEIEREKHILLQKIKDDKERKKYSYSERYGK